MRRLLRIVRAGCVEYRVLSSPLTIGYCDWPGWVAWEVALQKGFFEEAGVEVELKWFEYVPSMDAFAAKQLDAVCMTNGDTLVTGATGGRGVMILINDYSNGNDMVVAAPRNGSPEPLPLTIDPTGSPSRSAGPI